MLAADALGWGSRQGNGYDAQQALAANLMQFGLTLAGVIAAEDAQLARWLARHPAVDARRVGVLGFSFGGYRAWQAAALCPEVAAGVAASWMGRLGDLMQPGGLAEFGVKDTPVNLRNKVARGGFSGCVLRPVPKGDWTTRSYD